MDDVLIGQMAGLDDDALRGIIDSTSAQTAYLGQFHRDQEARAMAAICSVITVVAEAALLRRLTAF